MKIKTTSYNYISCPKIDNNLIWKYIHYVILQNEFSCFAMRSVMPIMKTYTLKLVYFSYFQPYAFIFWA